MFVTWSLAEAGGWLINLPFLGGILMLVTGWVLAIFGVLLITSWSAR